MAKLNFQQPLLHSSVLQKHFLLLSMKAVVLILIIVSFHFISLLWFVSSLLISPHLILWCLLFTFFHFSCSFYLYFIFFLSCLSCVFLFSSSHIPFHFISAHFIYCLFSDSSLSPRCLISPHLSSKFVSLFIWSHVVLTLHLFIFQ